MWVWLLLIPGSLFAQTVELGPAPLVPAGLPAPPASPAPRARNAPGNWFDLSSRSEVRNLYNTLYAPTNSVSTGWTGAVSGCAAGTTTQTFRDAVLVRINFVRGMAAVPMGITLDSNSGALDQEAALMMSANNQLNHSPPVSWTCFTTGGQTAAGKSNLCGFTGFHSDTGCIAGYMQDTGANNTAAGHRRWILYPQTQKMGTGDVNNVGSNMGANGLWVIENATYSNPRPATRDLYVAWPPPGYVPYQLIADRWSFSYPGANFGSATVTMTRNGQAVNTTLEAVQNGYGENTLVWKTGLGPTNPGSDATVNVTVSNVMIGGSPQSFSYSTIIFDPAVDTGGGGASITVTTNPPGLSIVVDSVSYTAPRTFSWTPGSSHSIGVSSPQTSAGVRQLFTSWSDSGTQTHTINTPSSAATYTANFNTQYLLTAAASPPGSGTISTTPSSPDGYYNAGQSVQVQAVANSGNQFVNWSGSITGTVNPQNVTMNGALSITANFSSPATAVTVTTNPPGLGITVDGSSYTAPQSFMWGQGTQHTIATVSPQSASGARYLFNNWSDGGSQSHAVTVPASAITYTANFNTQYQLVTAVSPGGSGGVSATPASGDGYYDAGTSVQLAAVPASGFTFANWSGSLSGATTPQTVLMNAARSVTANFSASAACTYTLSQTLFLLSSTAGGATVNVTAPSGCVWTVSGGSTWIRAGAITQFTGSGAVAITYDLNTGGQRSANFTIAGQTVTFTQDGPVTGAAAGLRFVSLAPCRLMETRALYNFEGRTGSFGPPAVQAGETRTLIPSQSNVCQIPATAKAYVFNVTLVPQNSIDYVTIWPAGQSRPDYWTARSPDGQIVANSAIVAAGTGGGIQVYASNSVDMILDISGYYTDNAQVSNLVYYPLTPCRVVDTRIAYRTPAGPFGPPTLAGNATRRFQIPATPYCSIPAGAAAYSVTLTVAPPGPLQFLTAWPAGGSQPNVSNINSPAGRILANSVIIPAAADGSIDVYAYDNTDLLIDINGYFAPDDGVNGLYYFPVTQCRLSDSSNGSFTGAFGGPVYTNESTRTLPVPASTRCSGIPANARAYALNVTAMPGGSPMPFLTVWPTGQPQPNASILNAFEGQTVTNSAIIPAGAAGAVNVFAYRQTHVAVEISGYFGR